MNETPLAARTVFYVAIQQLQGIQPLRFMKLARPMTLDELKALPRSAKPYIPLDREWMLRNKFVTTMVDDHCATSQVRSVTETTDGVVQVKTQGSTYQAIPDFTR